MEQNNLIQFLAIWGAFLSSVTLGWNLFRDIKQKGRLRVHCYIGNIIDTVDANDNKDYLVWSITNIGKEPVLLTHIGGEYKNKNAFILVPHYKLPKFLKPSEYHIEYTDNLSILDKQLKSLLVHDSLGRKFKVNNRQLKSIIKKHKKKD